MRTKVLAGLVLVCAGLLSGCGSSPSAEPDTSSAPPALALATSPPATPTTVAGPGNAKITPVNNTEYCAALAAAIAQSTQNSTSHDPQVALKWVQSYENASKLAPPALKNDWATVNQSLTKIYNAAKAGNGNALGTIDMTAFNNAFNAIIQKSGCK